MIYAITIVLIAFLGNAAGVVASTSTKSSTLTTSTTSSATSRPTSFQVTARNSGSKYDGRHLLGTDQSLSNVTFGTYPADDQPTSRFYLPGTNSPLQLRNANGETLYGGYNCGDQQLCSYDGSAAFLVFGGDDFPLYGYVNALCSNVPKAGGKFRLACSVKAKDGKAWYRKAIVSHDDGHVLLIPDGAAVPENYSFVEMEAKAV